MRLFTKKVSNCGECPAHHHDSGDGESPWEFEECHITEEPKALNNFPEIPEWCPLKTVEDNQVMKSDGPTWYFDPVPTHMGRNWYFVVVTKSLLRFIAWIEDGAFVTRLDNGTLHKFDNVLCWMPLPEL